MLRFLHLASFIHAGHVLQLYRSKASDAERALWQSMAPWQASRESDDDSSSTSSSWKTCSNSVPSRSSSVSSARLLHRWIFLGTALVDLLNDSLQLLISEPVNGVAASFRGASDSFVGVDKTKVAGSSFLYHIQEVLDGGQVSMEPAQWLCGPFSSLITSGTASESVPWMPGDDVMEPTPGAIVLDYLLQSPDPVRVPKRAHNQCTRLVLLFEFFFIAFLRLRPFLAEVVSSWVLPPSGSNGLQPARQCEPLHSLELPEVLHDLVFENHLLRLRRLLRFLSLLSSFGWASTGFEMWTYKKGNDGVTRVVLFRVRNVNWLHVQVHIQNLQITVVIITLLVGILHRIRESLVAYAQDTCFSKMSHDETQKLKMTNGAAFHVDLGLHVVRGLEFFPGKSDSIEIMKS
ncbi:unnamed protein product [Symbiodinium natans]|uniref:Uncharacterized protein n=1 Tax=Symbiodinium natans TaxID=878477 RepID=A0A812PV31_9DINO|nr:unnamed protein product [Symbiodinium natans]